MSGSNWVSWALPEWNDALIRAVFLDPEQSRRPLQRVTASDRFLARVAGADGAASGEVKSSFLRSFGTASMVARQFVWTSANQRSLLEGLPNFFGALYLTLLAGSADENTYDEGNFRVRFATLLKDVNFPDYFHFNDLPRMWRELEGWCRRQAEKGATCRQLVLPDPQRDTLIGYSKRLAFPSYSDESRLSNLLSGIGATEELTPAYVQKQVAQALSKFSTNFREEYQEFAKHYGSRRADNWYETPFWGAVQDIAWDLDCSEAKKNGRYDLVVDVTDYFEPWLTLLADDVGVDKIHSNCLVDRATPFSIGVHQIKPKEGAGWTPARLRSLASKNKAFASSRLGRAISRKQIVALPDETGQLRLTGTFFDGCRVACVIERWRAERLFGIAKEYRFDVALTPNSEGLSDDAILVFLRLDRNGIVRLKGLTADAIFDKILPPQSSRLSLCGGAWQGQLLLLNPASAPIAYVENAIGGSFEYIGRDGAQLACGAMEQVDDDGGFRVPPLIAAQVHEPYSIRMKIVNSSDREFVKLIHGLPVLREEKYTGLRDRTRWRIEGANGTLNDLSPEGFLALELSDDGRYGRGANTLLSNIADRMVFRPLEVKQIPNVSAMPLDHLHSGVRWLWDALSLRFQNSQALPYREILAHAEPAAKASATSPYRLIRLLEASGWLIRLASRAYRSVSFVPGPMELILENESPVVTARLVGPISSSVAADVKLFLSNGETIGVLLSPGIELSCGVIHLKLKDRDRLSELASKLGVSVVEPQKIRKPLGDRERLLFARTDRDNAWRNTGRKFEEWRWKEWKWIDLQENSSTVDGSLIRDKDPKGLDFFVPFGQDILSTNSETWARWLTTAIRKGAVADALQGGALMFDEEVFQVPTSLSRWWMLVGGGSVSIGANGALLFQGERTKYSGGALNDWIAMDEPISRVDIAMERRQLALRLSHKRGRRSAMS